MSNPQPSQHIQQLPNANIVGSLRIFSSFKSYTDFYEKIDLENRRVVGMKSTYLEVNDEVLRYTQDIINNRIEAIEWLGETYPKTLDELFSRDEYQLMDEYRLVYENNIKTKIDQIQKDSKALLDIPTIKYNDIGLGTFDFARASLGLLPIYKYYSLKYKKYVEGNETYVKKINESYKNFLKIDDSSVVIVPELIDGYDEKVVFEAFQDIFKGGNIFEVLKKYDLKIGKFSSSIKKTYLYKENIRKPLSAVRIFIYVGGNSNIKGEQFKWTGYTGIGIAELLNALGYNVSIHAIFGIKNPQYNDNGNFTTGIRASAVTLKPFLETLHSQRLLYIVSDPSFFRGLEFTNIVKKSQYYNDGINGRLGQSVDSSVIKQLAYNTFGKIDKQWKSDGSHDIQSGLLYYVVSNILNESMMNQEILNIALTVVNENRNARESNANTQNP